MTIRYLVSVFLLLPCILPIHGQKSRNFEIKSPDGNITVKITTGPKIEWSAIHKGQEIISASPVSMKTTSGDLPGENPSIRFAPVTIIDNQINAINYIKSVADRDATDYRKETISVTKNDRLKFQLSPGGGWAARIEQE